MSHGNSTTPNAASKSMLDHALALAQRGFRVFALEPNQKVPADISGDFPNRATSDPKTLERWWSSDLGPEWGVDYNPGIATGCGIVGIDIDAHKGTTFDEVAAKFSFPVTFTVRTPRGGWHLYFTTDPDTYIPNSAGKLGTGIDVRGDHGYLVAPGATIDAHGIEGTYEVIRDVPLAPLPFDIEQELAAPRPARGQMPQEPATELDTPTAIERAKAYLLDDAPFAIEGQFGDRTTFDVAMRLLDFGVSPATAVELLVEHWNGEKADPPWPVEELTKKVESALRRRERPLGADAIEASFEPVESSDSSLRAPPQLTSHAKGMHLTRAAEIEAAVFRDRAKPLVKDLLDQGALSVWYGDSNVGKTFVVLDVAEHIATGRSWNGKRVEQRAVVYVAAEGGIGLPRRILAMQRKRGPAEKLFLISSPVNMLRPGADMQKLGELIREAEQEAGMPVGLVVLDTLSRVLSGGDENSSVDMGAFIQNVDRLRAATKAHVALVHHTGKDAAKGARGWSGLRAAVDTEIEIEKGTMAVTKQREMEYGDPFTFALAGVDLGVDGEGETVRSAVVEWGGAFKKLPLTPVEQEVLDCALAWCEREKNDTIRRGEWRKEVILDAEKRGVRTGHDNSTFSKLLESLWGKGYVEKLDGNQWFIKTWGDVG